MTEPNQNFAVDIPYQDIVQFCLRWNVQQFYLFGSVLRSDFHPLSDIDVLVDFLPNAKIGWDIVTMNDELETIFQRRVDLITKPAIEQSNNWLRQQNILGTATLIYDQQQ
jgi:predicted nucleotidyltransferase